MNKETDKINLISYLYGELSVKEKKDFELLMQNNPELKREYEELVSTREFTQKLSDKSIEEPLFIPPVRKTGFKWKHWMSVAATLLFFLLFSFFTGFRVNKENGHLIIGFGLPQKMEENESFTKQEVESLLNKSLAEYDAKLDARWQNVTGSLEGRFSQLELKNTNQMNQAVNRLAKVNQQQIEGYVAQLSEEQKDQIKTLLASQSENQEEFLKDILLDFGSFMEKQRASDLEYIESYITSVQEESRKGEIENRELLASIVNQASNKIVAD